MGMTVPDEMHIMQQKPSMPSPWSNELDSRFWRGFRFTLAAGASQICRAYPNSDVDSWIFYVIPLAAARVGFYPGESRSSEGAVIGGGGDGRVPGNGPALYIINEGATSVECFVYAERKIPWLRVSPGQLA